MRLMSAIGVTSLTYHIALRVDETFKFVWKKRVLIACGIDPAKSE